MLVGKYSIFISTKLDAPFFAYGTQCHFGANVIATQT